MLWLVGVALPVFLAACHGMPYRFTKMGRVIDRHRRRPIPGIQVTCVQGNQRWDVVQSAESGEFVLDYDTPCSEILAEDIDGVDNGLYRSAAAPFCQDCPEVVIEMQPK